MLPIVKTKSKLTYRKLLRNAAAQTKGLLHAAASIECCTCMYTCHHGLPWLRLGEAVKTHTLHTSPCAATAASTHTHTHKHTLPASCSLRKQVAQPTVTEKSSYICVCVCAVHDTAPLRFPLIDILYLLQNLLHHVLAVLRLSSFRLPFDS